VSPHGDSLSDEPRAHPAIQSSAVAARWPPISSPSLQDSSDVASEDGEPCNGNGAMRFRLQVMVLKEPRLPLHTGKPVDWLGTSEIVRERAIDKFDARIFARVRGDEVVGGRGHQDGPKNCAVKRAADPNWAR